MTVQRAVGRVGALRPDYYLAGGLEPLDVIRDWSLGFLSGNVVKYVQRAGRKGPVHGDLVKALSYAELLHADIARGRWLPEWGCDDRGRALYPNDVALRWQLDPLRTQALIHLYSVSLGETFAGSYCERLIGTLRQAVEAEAALAGDDPPQVLAA